MQSAQHPIPHPLLRTIVSSFAPLQPVDDTGILLHQATDLYALWEALEKVAGGTCNPPFWGTVWPGARLIASFLLANQALVSGKSVLDIGSGAGLVAIAALRAGARHAVANDIDPDALSVSEWNAIANNVKLSTDHRNLTVHGGDQCPDIVTAADMFYEATTADHLFSLLHTYRQKGAEVLIADGNRPFTPRHQLTLLSTSTFNVNKAVEGRTERITSLYRIRT